MLQTNTFEDLGGGINAGAAPEALSPREWADARNFYPYESVARRRGGIRLLTTESGWDDQVKGMRRLKRNNGTQFFILGGLTKFGKYLDRRVDDLIVRDAIGTNPGRDLWTIQQYKNFAYGLRRYAGGIFRLDGYVQAKAGLVAPTVAHTLSSVLSGTTLAVGAYRAVYTYGNAATGYESNPSPVSNPVTLAAGSALQHSGFTFPTDPFLDTIYVYRSLVNQNNGIYYRIATIPSTSFNALASTYVDFIAISGLGQQVSYNNGVPPTDLIFGDIWDERLWASNGRDVRFSEVLNVEAWGDENQIDTTPDDGFDVRGIKAWDDRVVIGKTNAINYVTGSDRRSFDVHTLSEKHGVMSHFTMKAAEGQLFFYGSGKAVYRSDGTSVVEISNPKIKPFLEAILDEDEEFLTAAVFPGLNWYVLALPGTSLEFSSLNTYLVYNYASNTWSVFDHNLGGDLVTFLDDVFDEDNGEALRIGTSGGDLLRLADPTYDYDDRFVQELYDCPGSATGIIGDGTGAAAGHAAANGFALLCNDASTATLGPVQANGSGVWLFPSVPAGTYTLTIYDAIDQAYRTTVGAVTVVDHTLTSDGTRTLNTLGAHPACT